MLLALPGGCCTCLVRQPPPQWPLVRPEQKSALQSAPLLPISALIPVLHSGATLLVNALLAAPGQPFRYLNGAAIGSLSLASPSNICPTTVQTWFSQPSHLNCPPYNVSQLALSLGKCNSRTESHIVGVVSTQATPPLPWSLHLQ